MLNEIREYITDIITDEGITEAKKSLLYCYKNKNSHHISDFERLLKKSNIKESELLNLLEEVKNVIK